MVALGGLQAKGRNSGRDVYGAAILEDRPMAESSNGSNNFLYFIVGALVIAVGAFAFFYFEGRGGGSDINVKVDVPKVSTPN
jgi:hypothetical protein